MTLRTLDLTGATATVTPASVTEATSTDPDTGAVSLVLESATGVVSSGSMTVDVSSLPIQDPAYAASDGWEGTTGVAVLQFPAWPAGQAVSPCPAGTIVCGVLSVKDGQAAVTWPTGFTPIPNSPQKNTNGSDQANAFTYVCDGTECGTEGGNNPKAINITYDVNGTEGALIWDAWSNAQLAASNIVPNQSSPAETVHDVPTVTTPGGPVIYAVVGRTSTSVQMGASNQDTADTTLRIAESTTSTTSNNMGGCIYDEANVAAGTTPDRKATTEVGTFSVGVVFALEKVTS